MKTERDLTSELPEEPPFRTRKEIEAEGKRREANRDDTPVHNFTPTRGDLGILARYFMDEYYDVSYFIRKGGCIWRSLLYEESYFGGRLGALREILGEDFFKLVTFETQEKWNKTIAEFEKSERACKNYGQKDHAHLQCALEEEDSK